MERFGQYGNREGRKESHLPDLALFKCLLVGSPAPMARGRDIVYRVVSWCIVLY